MAKYVQINNDGLPEMIVGDDSNWHNTTLTNMTTLLLKILEKEWMNKNEWVKQMNRTKVGKKGNFRGLNPVTVHKNKHIRNLLHKNDKKKLMW